MHIIIKNNACLKRVQKDFFFKLCEFLMRTLYKCVYAFIYSYMNIIRLNDIRSKISIAL